MVLAPINSLTKHTENNPTDVIWSNATTYLIIGHRSHYDKYGAGAVPNIRATNTKVTHWTSSVTQYVCAVSITYHYFFPINLLQFIRPEQINQQCIKQTMTF